MVIPGIHILIEALTQIETNDTEDVALIAINVAP